MQPLVVEPVAVVLQDQRRLVVRQRLRADVDLLRVHVRVRRVVDELGDGAEGPLVARRVGVQELGVRRRVLDPRRAVQRDALPLRRRGGALRLAAAAVAGVLVLVAALVALRRAVKGLRRVHVHLLLLDLRLAAARAAVRRRGVHGLRGRSRRRGRGRSLRRIRSLSRSRRRPVLLLDQVPATAQHVPRASRGERLGFLAPVAGSLRLHHHPELQVLRGRPACRGVRVHARATVAVRGHCCVQPSRACCEFAGAKSWQCAHRRGPCFTGAAPHCRLAQRQWQPAPRYRRPRCG